VLPTVYELIGRRAERRGTPVLPEPPPAAPTDWSPEQPDFVLRERVIVRGTAPYDGVEGSLVFDQGARCQRDRPRAQRVAFGCRGV